MPFGPVHIMHDEEVDHKCACIRGVDHPSWLFDVPVGAEGKDSLIDRNKEG